MATDLHLPADARLYGYRHYQSVFALPEWPDLAAWKRQRRQIRQHLLLCAGLNARTAAFRARGRVVRRFEHEGVAIENLCIETLPGLFVLGNLYRPATATSPVPLVLHPHGHAMHARTVPLGDYSVPHRAFNTALLGMAGFAYTMIGYDRDAMQLEHRGLLRGPDKAACNLLGLSLFGLQLNNSIKALDYLLARADIDPRRVACTGESGGGTQTYFLAAVDERVRVAAPAVMLSGHFQGGCECENAPRLHPTYGNLHYAGLIAPRPLLLLGCTGDWTHHLREREYPCLRDLDRRYGRQEAIACFYQDAGHNFDRISRERLYAWTARWLLDGDPERTRIPESDRPVPSPQDLLVFDTPVPPARRAIRSRKQLLTTWRALHRGAAAPAQVAAVLDLELPPRSDLLVRSQPPRRLYRRQRDRLHSIAYGRFSEDSHLRCRFAPPRRGRACYVILRSWQDEAAWTRFCDRPPAALRQLLDAGDGVLVPILFRQVVHPAVATWCALADDADLASTYNRTAHQQRAGDILTTVRLAQVEMGVAAKRLVAVADSGMGLLAWAAWASLRRQTPVGPLAADLGGADLRRESTWVKRAYIPLLLGAGGAAGLAALWDAGRGGPACFTGVHPGAGPLLPRRCARRAQRAGLAELIALAVRLRPALAGELGGGRGSA